jgi:integrase
LAYTQWRASAQPREGVRAGGPITAAFDLVLLGILMSEAVIRGYCASNPLYKLRIYTPAGKMKPELTNENMVAIEKQIALEKEPKRSFFYVSFMLGRYHGCRISETLLNPMTDVEFAPPGSKGFDIIRLVQKGNKPHTKPLHHACVPMFRELQQRKATTTYKRPSGPSGEWGRLFNKIGLPGVTFHSLRVTAASRMARSNKVSLRQAMEYLSHASTTVHAAYVRWRPEDVAVCHDALT